MKDKQVPVKKFEKSCVSTQQNNFIFVLIIFKVQRLHIMWLFESNFGDLPVHMYTLDKGIGYVTMKSELSWLSILKGSPSMQPWRHTFCVAIWTSVTHLIFLDHFQSAPCIPPSYFDCPWNPLFKPLSPWRRPVFKVAKTVFNFPGNNKSCNKTPLFFTIQSTWNTAEDR